MTAVGTNVVIRFLIGDDSYQHAQAVDLIGSATCYVPDSVVLETVWVLGSVYTYARDDIHPRSRSCSASQRPRADAVRPQQTLAWYADGLYFAGAMHLASAQHPPTSFDRCFTKRATGKGSSVVRESL